MTSDKDFVKRALINQQEAVRDYQRFAQSTDNPQLKKMFGEFAQQEGLQAQKIKALLEDWKDD